MLAGVDHVRHNVLHENTSGRDHSLWWKCPIGREGSFRATKQVTLYLLAANHPPRSTALGDRVLQHGTPGIDCQITEQGAGPADLAAEREFRRVNAIEEKAERKALALGNVGEMNAASFAFPKAAIRFRWSFLLEKIDHLFKFYFPPNLADVHQRGQLFQ